IPAFQVSRRADGHNAEPGAERPLPRVLEDLRMWRAEHQPVSYYLPDLVGERGGTVLACDVTRDLGQVPLVEDSKRGRIADAARAGKVQVGDVCRLGTLARVGRKVSESRSTPGHAARAVERFSGSAADIRPWCTRLRYAFQRMLGRAFG